MIYDIDGTQINSICNRVGESLLSAYDISGDMVFPSASLFKVMTYNVQWFSGINGQQAMQQSIINNNDADIIGFQEMTTNGTIPTVGINVLSSYPNKRLSNHKNYMCMASKKPLSNVVIEDFVNQDPEDASRYNETRAYMIADVYVNGKTIKWINTHLAPNTAEYKYLQMAEVLALAINKEYCIITGDFNSLLYESSSDAEYARMYAPFANAGFKMANHNPNSFTKTWTNISNATSLADFTYPTDDIIVSSNIDIVDVVFDTTKLSNLNGQSIDHIPIIATLKIT